MNLAPPVQSSSRHRALSGNQGFDWSFAWPWVLGFGLTVYLGLEGGGFDPLVSDQIGVAAWWVLLFAVGVGALPRRTPTTVAWWALGLLAGFAVWTALSLTWTESTEKTATDLARVATYLGVFALAVFSRGPRGVRHTVTAVAAAVGLLAVIALLSRLHPSWFPSGNQTGQFLETGRERLSYPLNYWNALAALIAIGAPLILYVAASARQVAVRALAAAVFPALALTAFFTLSRGGIGAIVVAVVVFLALTPDRLPKLLTLVVATAGGGVLVLLASKRDDLVHGYATSLAHDQGSEMLLYTIVVCLLVGLLQAGFTLALDRGARPGWARVSRRRTQIVVGSAAAVILVAALALGAPGKISNAWSDFKQPSSGPGHGTERLGSVAGESRYQFWSSAAREFTHEPLTGTGSGTFAIWWTQDGDSGENVVDTHSLYMQTLGELGLVGLALLAAFIALGLTVGTRRVLGSTVAARPALAAALAGSTAIWVTSIFDWTWKVPVLPIASLLLIAALLTSRETASEGPVEPRIPLRVATALVAVAAIVAIAIPLASTSLIRQSQAAVNDGDVQGALDDAHSAQNVMPGAAGPRLQQALVLETAGDFDAAAAAATAATAKEPHNWRLWLVLSRIEAERGRAAQAVADYRTARSLNPHGQIFQRD
ncbi:MAG: tetratricopeptide repeat protein [Solirubrobacterales bacterium]